MAPAEFVRHILEDIHNNLEKIMENVDIEWDTFRDMSEESAIIHYYYGMLENVQLAIEEYFEELDNGGDE